MGGSEPEKKVEQVEEEEVGQKEEEKKDPAEWEDQTFSQAKSSAGW